jgi:hypothetical protein
LTVFKKFFLLFSYFHFHFHLSTISPLMLYCCSYTYSKRGSVDGGPLADDAGCCYIADRNTFSLQSSTAQLLLLLLGVVPARAEEAVAGWGHRHTATAIALGPSTSSN